MKFIESLELREWVKEKLKKKLFQNVSFQNLEWILKVGGAGARYTAGLKLPAEGLKLSRNCFNI